MTYIEFFDKTSVENVGACLSYVPDRAILIGTDEKQLGLMNKYALRYERLFSDRGYSVPFLTRAVGERGLESAIELLEELVHTYDDCVFDVTGGDELLVLALGIVYARNPDSSIQIHRFNLRNNTILDYDKDGVTVWQEPPTLSIDENVRIYGGDVVYGEIHEDKTYLWDLTPGFLRDVEIMWSSCRRDVRRWNAQIGVLEAMELVGTVSEDGLTTTATIAEVDAYLSKFRASSSVLGGLARYMVRQKLLTHFDDTDGVNITVSYKNEQVKKCMTKAGQALEMKIYTTVKALTGKGNEPLYNDALNGVVIDWDGTLHDEAEEGIYDTENEIDVMLMHGIVPVFVSCKNGIVTSEELYKLNAVAERFGGTYAKKVLVATSVGAMGEAGQYLCQRARDMGIRLIEGVQTMSDAELQRELRTLWK